MEFTLTFGAVGDFIAVLDLIKNIVAALDDSRGSKKEYQDVVTSLKILESILRQVDEVYRDQELRGELRMLALRQVEQIRRCLLDFCDKISKFGPSLANNGTKNVLEDAARKVQWKLVEKDVDRFRGELLAHSMSMNTLLELTTLSVVRQAHDATVQQISDSEERTKAAVQSSNISLMGYIGAVGQRLLSRLEFISKLVMDLRVSTSQIMSLVLSISGELSRIRTAMVRLERPLSDEYFVLEDAMGRVFPIHLRTITSWEILEFIITDRFKGRKGSHRTQKGRYVLQERATGREIDRSLEWETAFLPYQRVDMIIMCRDAHNTALEDTSPSCPRCMTVSPGEMGLEVQCKQCNIVFTRVMEVDDEPTDSPSRRPKSAGMRNCRKLRGNEFKKLRKGRHRKRRMERLLDEGQESDSDDEDVQGFVRIMLVSRLSHSSDFSTPSEYHPPNISESTIESGISQVRQREMRENSNFIRIAVMETVMRKRGKLDESRPGRARWALPPRKLNKQVYEVNADGVPARWTSMS